MLHKEDRAGIYITVIFHLAVIIVLLASQIGISLSKDSSFILDFTKQEQIEEQEKEDVFKDDISRRLEQLLAASSSSDLKVRNIAVDRSDLKDDRGTDAQKLYEDAQKLQNDLDKTFSREEKDAFTALEEVRDQKQDQKEAEKKAYQGPSVVSWMLEGRKASRLSIPAYQCMGGGLVTVYITVDPSGNVINAKVAETISSQDQCLRDYAIRAARLSKFSKSTDAPARQGGEITYQFIPQR